MFRCSEFCVASVQGPLIGKRITLHRCYICYEIVHNCCTSNYIIDHGNVLYICNNNHCTNIWRTRQQHAAAARQQQQQQSTPCGQNNINTNNNITVGTSSKASKKNNTDSSATTKNKEQDENDDKNNNNLEEEDGKPYAAATTTTTVTKEETDKDGDDNNILEYIEPHSSIIPTTRLISPFAAQQENKRKSMYWRYYHIYDNNNIINIEKNLINMACCNICGKSVTIYKCFTSVLQSHLKAFHKKQYIDLLNKNNKHKDNETNNNKKKIDIENHVLMQKYKNPHTSIQPPERLLNPKTDIRLKKFKSVFWNFFHYFDKDHPVNIHTKLAGRACCNICGQDVNHTDGSTSTLQSHLFYSHRDCYDILGYKKKTEKPESIIEAKRYLSRINSNNNNGNPITDYNKNLTLENIYSSIALWAIQGHGRSFDVIEDPLFRNILRQVHAASNSLTDADLVAATSNASDKNNSSTMMSCDVKQEMRMMAWRLRHSLKCKLDGTFPMVISTYHHQTIINNNNNERKHNEYTALAMHFIDENFKLVKFYISVVVHTDNVVIRKKGKRYRWSQLELDSSRVPFAITDTDYHSNKFRTEFNHLTKTKCFSSVDYDIQQLVNIVFQSKYFGDGENSELLRKARELSYFLTGSQEIEKALKDAQTSSRMDYDDPIPAIRDDFKHWWTMYNMAIRLVQLQPAINILVAKKILDLEQNLSNKDWMTLKDLLLVLRPLASCIKALKDAKYASFVPHILPKLRSYIEKNSATVTGVPVNQKVVECSRDMLQLYDLLYGNIVEKPEYFPKDYWIAMMLDPRFKNLKGVTVKSDFKEQLWKILEGEMRKNETAYQVAMIKSKKKKKSKNGKLRKPSVKRARRNTDEASVGFSHNEDSEDEDDENSESEETQLKYDALIVEKFISIDDIKSACAREISMYKTERGQKIAKEIGVYNDPWSWWRDRYEACPILWRMAQSYLCIPLLTNEAILMDIVEGVHIETFSPPTEIPESCFDLVKRDKNANADLIEDILLVKLNRVGVNREEESDRKFLDPMDNLPLNVEVIPSQFAQ